MPPRVLLVGSGITSSLTSYFIRQKAKESLYLEIWDKAKGVGGRMSTSRSPGSNSSQVDLGAQYITASPDEFVNYKEIYDSLIHNNLLVPLTAQVEGMKTFPSSWHHFVAPKGMNSVVRHFLQCDKIKFENHVTSLTRHGNQILVEAKSGDREMFDVVILTMPVPQLLEIMGSISLNSELVNSLKCVRYSSRYALGLFFDNSNTSFNESWDVKYIDNDDIFRYVAFDNRKRNCKNEPNTSVFHTSVQFGCRHIDRSIKDMEEILMARVKEKFPSWPEPVNVKCHKWRYSQVIEPYFNKPGYVVLSSNPVVLAGGDGFTESNFNGCVLSAKKLAACMIEMLSTK